jgi:hypothetical protein
VVKTAENCDRNNYVALIPLLTFVIVEHMCALVFRYVGADGVMAELFVAVLLLRAKLLQNSALKPIR